MNAYAASNPNSKKGIQGYEYLEGEDAEELGVNHVLLNFDMKDFISPVETYPVPYEGTNYYYTGHANAYMPIVSDFNKKGVTVTAVILLSWSDNTELQKLIYPDARDGGKHAFYGLNIVDADQKKKLEAFMDFMTTKYGAEDCHIDNWIIGNEVNMPNAYNYTGDEVKNINTDRNVQICAESYLMLYDALQRNNPNGKAYISLDHSWTHNDEGRGIAAKTFLDKFNSYINSKRGNISWNLAYHPYPAIMDSTAHTYNSGISYQETLLWNNRYTPNDVNADFVSTANLTVLTDYVKNNFGSDKRIILSELGYDVRYSAENQAASTAFAFYAGQFNDMVDAVIFRAYQDDANDGSFKLGFKDADGNERSSYNVYKYMDTANAKSYADPYLSLIGAGSWNEMFPAYSYEVLSGNPEQKKGGLVLSGDKWIYVVNGVQDTSYNGLVEHNGSWYCVANGEIFWGYTGLWCDPVVGWWYVENGAINFDYSGLVPYDGAWYCVSGGKLQWNYTGLWYDEIVGWWYVENGAINFSHNGLVEHNGAWYCVSGGRLQWDYTGLWCDSIVGWWYVENGTINFNYSGLVPYDGAWFCVSGGKLQWDYTGLFYDATVGWWYVENGVI